MADNLRGGTTIGGNIAWHAGNLSKAVIDALAVDASTVNGISNSTSSTTNTLVQRNASGDINMRLPRIEYTGDGWNGQYILGINAKGGIGTDNYARPTPVPIWNQDTTGNAATATTADTATTASFSETVRINTSSNTSTYGMVWHSGDTLYANSGFKIQPSTNNVTTDGGFTINGSIDSGAADMGYYQSVGTNLILKGDSNGRSGIFFESEKDGTNINHTSDYGFIQYHARGYGNTSGESNNLVIGVANDSSDQLILQAPYNNGVKIGYKGVNTGTGLTLGTVYHSGNIPTWNQDTTGNAATADTATTATNADKLDNIDSTGFMRQVHANGYDGMATQNGATLNWIRTTGSGLIPYQSGGASALGTSSWPFNNIYGNNIYDGGTLLENKYLGKTAKAVDSDKLDGLDSSGFARVNGDSTKVFRAAEAVDVDDALTKGQLTGAIGNINSPLLDLPLQNSLTMNKGVGSVNFTRSTAATYIDRYGVLQYADIDEPRFEKDGLLIEGSSTNLCTYSQDFTDGNRFKAVHNGTLEQNKDNIDGSTDAVKIVTSTDHEPQMFGRFGYAIPKNTTVTSSVIVEKSGDYKYFQITSGNYSSWETRGYVRFDLDAGVIVAAITDDGTGTITGAITNLGNNKYRCEIRGQVRADNDNTSNLYFTILEATTGTDFAGDGTSGFIIHNIQTEELPFASSYIPTTTSAVTRGSDVCNVTRSGNVPNVEKDGEATVFCEASLPVFSQNSTYLWGLCRNVYDCMGLYCYSNTIRTRCKNADYRRDLTSTNITFSNNTLYNFTWIANNSFHKLYINGVLNAENTTPSTGITTTQNSYYDYIRIGGSSPASPSTYMHIRSIKIYDKALTATEVALLGQEY